MALGVICDFIPHDPNGSVTLNLEATDKYRKAAVFDAGKKHINEISARHRARIVSGLVIVQILDKPNSWGIGKLNKSVSFLSQITRLVTGIGCQFLKVKVRKGFCELACHRKYAVRGIDDFALLRPGLRIFVADKAVRSQNYSMVLAVD